MDLKYIVKWKKPDSKATYCMIPFTWYSGKDSTTRAENRSGVCQELGVEGRANYKKAQEILRGNETVLHLECALVRTNRTEYQMSKFYRM